VKNTLSQIVVAALVILAAISTPMEHVPVATALSPSC
jgi:hypothetical protein